MPHTARRTPCFCHRCSCVADCSEIWQAHSGIMQHATEQFTNCVRTHLLETSGYETQRQGDAFLLVFRRCAWPKPSQSLRLAAPNTIITTALSPAQYLTIPNDTRDSPFLPLPTQIQRHPRPPSPPKLFSPRHLFFVCSGAIFFVLFNGHFVVNCLSGASRRSGNDRFSSDGNSFTAVRRRRNRPNAKPKDPHVFLKRECGGISIFLRRERRGKGLSRNRKCGRSLKFPSGASGNVGSRTKRAVRPQGPKAEGQGCGISETRCPSSYIPPFKRCGCCHKSGLSLERDEQT